jgi:hypothetical protein
MTDTQQLEAALAAARARPKANKLVIFTWAATSPRSGPP